ncbi:hypothetical protein ABZ613_37075 [Streptomyces collinus]|uniref:hypothetical protein n=1 Tax=Streptomyces collinus TaxID=42684 RepID=UPI0033D05F66
MSITIDDNWTATVTDDPLHITPRFDFRDFRMRIATYTNVEERGRFLLDTFGSEPWLWDTPDELRFDQAGRELVGAEFQIPGVEAADAEDSARVPATPLVHPGGLRADQAQDFRLEVTTELCRAPGDAVLTCLRDLDVLDEPLEARIGIAPDVALLVQPTAPSSAGLIDGLVSDALRLLGHLPWSPARNWSRRRTPTGGRRGAASAEPWRSAAQTDRAQQDANLSGSGDRPNGTQAGRAIVGMPHPSFRRGPPTLRLAGSRSARSATTWPPHQSERPEEGPPETKTRSQPCPRLEA